MTKKIHPKANLALCALLGAALLASCGKDMNEPDVFIEERIAAIVKSDKMSRHGWLPDDPKQKTLKIRLDKKSIEKEVQGPWCEKLSFVGTAELPESCFEELDATQELELSGASRELKGKLKKRLAEDKVVLAKEFPKGTPIELRGACWRIRTSDKDEWTLQGASLRATPSPECASEFMEFRAGFKILKKGTPEFDAYLNGLKASGKENAEKIKALEDECDRLTAEADALAAEISAIETKMNAIVREGKSSKRDLDNLQSRLAAEKANRNSARPRQKARAERNVPELERRIADLEKGQEALNGQWNECQKLRQEKEGALAPLRTRLEEKRNELQKLREAAF